MTTGLVTIKLVKWLLFLEPKIVNYLAIKAHIILREKEAPIHQWFIVGCIKLCRNAAVQFLRGWQTEQNSACFGFGAGIQVSCEWGDRLLAGTSSNVMDLCLVQMKALHNSLVGITALLTISYTFQISNLCILVTPPLIVTHVKVTTHFPCEAEWAP